MKGADQPGHRVRSVRKDQKKKKKKLVRMKAAAAAAV